MKVEEDRMDEEEDVLEQVFGHSSDSESDSGSGSDCNCNSMWWWEWEAIHQVKGLWICRNFLSPNQQSRLVSAIQSENWFTEPSANQAMRFGDLPQWAIQLSHSIRESVVGMASDEVPLPLHLLWREPLFDQMIVNVYEPGEGICAHVDLLRFEDAIAIVSLESSCVMHFTQSQSQSQSVPVPVLLTPGSLVLMSGEARYRWKHEINRRPGFQLWQGQELDQRKRTSITLRKLCSTS